MKRKYGLSSRLISLLLCMAMVFAYVPAATSAADATNPYYNRVVDANTMDGWKEYFDLTDLNTANAGGVWTDKSVFTDASAFGGKVSMLDNNRNFLTALSAIAANKEVVGYSTIPTDTVLVLDLSNSMDGYESQLISAANQAIATLLNNNENNRVGVVLYSGHNSNSTSAYSEGVTRLLPIDRYTAGNGGTFLTYSGDTVSVTRGVTGENNPDLSKTKRFQGATYIQAGLWEAMKMFEEMDTVIGDNNWQEDKNRMPILVLMSDGAPTTGTSYYDDVENSQYRSSGFGGGSTVYKSNVGNGSSSNLRAGNVFLTQLTASYVMNRITNHYRKTDPSARSLFYTLGFNVRGNEHAESVLDPDSSTLTDELWRSYNALATGSLSVRVKGRDGNATDVSIQKNSYVTDKSYVDEYFTATQNGLANAFASIVEEILIQSRYYPTHLEGGSPDFSGYVEFTDTIGEYMEVKDIKGILLGNTLFDGHMMASKLSNSSDDGLGTVERPTELGDEFIRAVKTRLGIAETVDAQALVAKAFNAGQLRYNSATDWSNYIGWYAKADGTYAGFWDENASSAAPEGAVYKIRSYGFLGETTGSIKNSDMMYMSVQVSTNIATGQQTVHWKIPAALVPLITYSVTLDGKNVDEAKNVSVAVKDAATIAPIRLIFESGLRSDLNELNITRIEDQKHIAADGVSRQFWTNHFDISSAQHEDHVTTMSEFTPSKENERFYYTFDSAVFKKVGNSYVLVEENEGTAGKLNTAGEYYHRRYIFTDDSTTPIFFYEKMSAASIGIAAYDSNYVTRTGEIGAWVVEAGTPARELQMYSKLKADEDATGSAHMVFYPYLTEYNNHFYVDMNLGNNGLLEVTPAQGIKLSKTVDVFEPGTSDAFRFRITVHNANGTPYTGSLDSYKTALDVVPQGAATVINMSSTGAYTVDLTKDQTFWLTGLPAGSHYTIEEISDNEDYKIKSVHVNGVSAGKVAAGTIAANFIDDVDFVNTAIGEGDLVITKQVVDANGAIVDVADSLEFTAVVTLTDETGAPVSGTFAATGGNVTVPANGKFTVKLGDGESFVIRGIPEETRYTVEETNIPAGFALNTQMSRLTGAVDADSNDQALIVNTYQPVAVGGGNIAVQVSKEISGNRTQWQTGEAYTFTLERVSVSRATVVDTVTISTSDAQKQAQMNLSAETFTDAGTYYYRITETVGTQGGVTYDTAERRFHVVVADSDMDGDLEIVAVNNEALTTVVGNYTVSAVFNNVYQPTGTATVTVNVLKKMNGNHGLAGFRFALYNDAALENEVLRSTVTNAAGTASFTLNFAANRASIAGEVYTYYMAELPGGNPNITDSTAVYKVDVTVKDNGDGTITATPVVSVVSGGALEGGIATFTNTYTPSASDFVTITGTKEIQGDRVLNTGEFTFTITADTPNAPLPADTTAKNKADGSFAFGAIEFAAVGDFVYVISEVKTNPIGGFTYDEAQYKVYISVVDNGDATLTAKIAKIEKLVANTSPATVSDIVFINKYDAEDAKKVISGTKLLTGKVLQDGEFSFRLSAVTPGAPLPTNTVITNDENGGIAFGEITYSKAGVYVYELTEISGTDTRYSYDTSVYTVTVTVTDNSQGVLSAEVKLTKNGLASTEIVFRNSFTPTPITYNIHTDFGGQKVLEGRPLEADEFEFTLINAITGQQVGESVKNDAAGKFYFPEVTLTTAGIYHYKITEVIGTEKGVTYDTSSYHIRLEVEQDASGNLVIIDKQLHKGVVAKQEVGGVLTEVTTYTDITTGGQIVFTNTYRADPVYVTLEATKLLTGRDLVDGEFKFDLHKTAADYAWSENTLVQHDVVHSLQSDGTGAVTFMPEMFDAEGTYYFVIVEDEVAQKGVTPDTTVYKVEITVTDNHAGDLVAALKVDGTAVTGSTASAVVFRNTYSAAATQIVIEGTKILSGRDLLAEEFSFELYGKDNAKLETVKNNAEGKFAFTAIPVDEAGVYTYTVREVKGSATGVTYDETVYTVTVTVTDNLDGTFKVEYAYQKGNANAEAITFVNTYTAPAPEPEPAPAPENPKTGDGTPFRLLIPMMLVSGACLVGIVAFYKKKEQ